MKIIYLLPPSEGKNQGGTLGIEEVSFMFKKPLDIAISATEKDLKCKEKRYEEGIELNTSLLNSLSGEEREAGVSSSPGGEELRGGFMSAIERYSGVMYNAIDYFGMPNDSKLYFKNSFVILSGMYGVLRPLDAIGNYKLPIETKGLYKYWGEQITDVLNEQKLDLIVDLLPGSYKKMIHWKNIHSPVLEIDFFAHKDKILKKMTHGVKKVKGEYIYELCGISPDKLEDFPGKLEKISENRYKLSVTSS